MTLPLRPDCITLFDHEEQLTPREAADLLVDIAYGLTASSTVELRSSSQRLSVPVGEPLIVRRTSARDGECLQLNIELRWIAT